MNAYSVYSTSFLLCLSFLCHIFFVSAHQNHSVSFRATESRRLRKAHKIGRSDRIRICGAYVHILKEWLVLFVYFTKQSLHLARKLVPYGLWYINISSMSPNKNATYVLSEMVCLCVPTEIFPVSVLYGIHGNRLAARSNSMVCNVLFFLIFFTSHFSFDATKAGSHTS